MKKKINICYIIDALLLAFFIFYPFFGSILRITMVGRIMCLIMLAGQLFRRQADGMNSLGTALVVLLVYILCSDWLVSFIAAALVEAPVLLLHLRGEDARVLEAFNALLKRLSVFEPLSAFVNGIFDVGTIAGYLTVAALFACLTGLAIAARRRGERRAL